MTTERIQDIDVDEQLSENVKAGFANLDLGLNTVTQALGQIQSAAGSVNLGAVDAVGSSALGAGNQLIDNVQSKLEQVLQQVQSIKGGL